MTAASIVRNRKIWLVAMTLVLFTAGVWFVFWRGNDSNQNNFLRRVGFTISTPVQPTKGLETEANTLKYNQANQAYAYTVKVDGKPVDISQQATPDIFSESGVYDYKLQQSNEYDDFSTDFGDVTLTKPAELNGQTVAWVNSKGTLTLAHAVGQSLSESDWKLLFNNMQAQN